jgi:hypothetical protein
MNPTREEALFAAAGLHLARGGWGLAGEGHNLPASLLLPSPGIRQLRLQVEIPGRCLFLAGPAHFMDHLIPSHDSNLP